MNVIFPHTPAGSIWGPQHLCHVRGDTTLWPLPSLSNPSLMLPMCCAPQTSGEKKRSGHSDSNGFAGHINLPDLVQQSHSPAGTPTEGLGRVSTHSQEMESGTEVGTRQQSQQLCTGGGLGVKPCPLPSSGIRLCKLPGMCLFVCYIITYANTLMEENHGSRAVKKDLRYHLAQYLFLQMTVLRLREAK